MYLIRMTCPACHQDYTVESTTPKDKRIHHCAKAKKVKK